MSSANPATADGGFLFGRFSIADAFYAPVVLRFETYGNPCARGRAAAAKADLKRAAT